MEYLKKIKNKLYILVNLLFLQLVQINTVYATKATSSNTVVTVKKGQRVLSEAGGNNIGELTNFFSNWLVKIGGIIMFYGAITFALGFTRDDADSKTKGLTVMAAGGLLIALKTFNWI